MFIESSPNMIKEVEKLPSNFKQITPRCFTLLDILIRIADFVAKLFTVPPKIVPK